MSRLSQDKFSCLHHLILVLYKIYLGSKCERISLLETEISVDQQCQNQSRDVYGPPNYKYHDNAPDKNVNRRWRDRLANSDSSNHKFPRKLPGKNFNDSPYQLVNQCLQSCKMQKSLKFIPCSHISNFCQPTWTM
jgi:hypothetical protein